MSFDPCPSSLQSGRVASFKSADRLSGSWPDTSGTYSLTNNGSVGTRHPRQGRTIVGPATACDWQGLQVWSTTDAALLRNGQNWTKCGVLWHTFSSFDAQPAISFGISSGGDSGSRLHCCVVRNTGGLSLWEFRSPTMTGSWPVRSFDMAEPIMFSARYDYATTSLQYHFWRLSTGEQLVASSVYTLAANNSHNFFGRQRTDVAADYNGSQTIIDCIQIFNSVLSDSQLQLICSHIWSQRLHMLSYFKGRGMNVIDLGEQIGNQPLKISAQYLSSVDGSRLTSATLAQSDITIIPDEDAGSGSAGVTTSTASPTFVSDGNGYLTYQLTATDTNHTGGCTITIWPAGALPVQFRACFVGKKSTARLVDIESDTNELQTDWVNGGRLDNLLDARMPTSHIAATAGKVNGVAAVDLCAANTDMRGTDNALLASAYEEPDNDGISSLSARLTSTRAGYLDKLNVSGTLAHSDAAAIYQADVSAILETSEKLAGMLEEDEGEQRFREKALEQGPAGTIVGGDASEAKQDEILARLGSWTGTGMNSVLGAFRALFSKSASKPSDLTGGMEPQRDSVEAVGEALKRVTGVISRGGISVVSHQLPGEAIVLVRGDSYRESNNRPLSWINLTGAGWPEDLAEAVISFTAVSVTESGKLASEVLPVKRIVATGYVTTATGPNQEVRCELNSSETNRDAGLYDYDVEAILPGGEVHTLVTTADQIRGGLASSQSSQNRKKLVILPDYSGANP